MRNKYPEFFKNYLRGRYIEVGLGWESIVETMLEELRLSKEAVDILQIKEKFGELTVYHNQFNNVRVTMIIERAKINASKTCDKCGKIGELREKSGWLAVRCKEHD